MGWLKNRRMVVFGGMGLALTAGLIIAAMVASSGPASEGPPPAAEGGLVVQTGRDDDIKLDPKRPLRCFVKGQFVGELPLSECAQRNGVATGALDVGLDTSGALAAAKSGGAALTPLASGTKTISGDAAPPPDPDIANASENENAAVPTRKTSICWRYVAGQWERVAGEVDLAACARAVFAGRCSGAAAVQFGRWGERGLRSSAGRIELTSEDGDYRPLTSLTPACAVAPFG